MLSTAFFPWPLRRLTSPSVLSGQGSIASGPELKGEGMLLVCSDSGHHLIHSEQYLFTLPSALQLCLVVIRVKALLAGVSKATPPPMSGGDFSEPGLQGHHYPYTFWIITCFSRGLIILICEHSSVWFNGNPLLEGSKILHEYVCGSMQMWALLFI